MSQKEVIYTWPPTMTAATAARYCQCTVEAINKARREGVLAPAGQRGGNGAITYARTELDRWMRGQGGES